LRAFRFFLLDRSVGADQAHDYKKSLCVGALFLTLQLLLLFYFSKWTGAAYNKHELEKAGITHIITLTPSAPNNFEDSIVYLRIDIHDTEKARDSLLPYFNVTNNFINKAREGGGKVMVHCWEGMSRSVSTIMAYLIKYHGMSVKSSLSLIEKTRPDADPNPRYRKGLKQYAKELSVIKRNN
jgi:hypothetical protein